jgi:hypothetical protein
VELLTPKEAAEILKIKEKTLQQWRTLKRVPLRYRKLNRPGMVGGCIRYTREDIERFIEASAREGDGSDVVPRRRRVSKARA